MHAQAIAQQFMAAYGEQSQSTYHFIRTECLFRFGDAKSFSVNACDWLNKTTDEMELWILEHIVAKLAGNWPPAHSRAINDVIWAACNAHANAPAPAVRAA